MRCRVGINAEGGGRSRPERRDHGAGLPCRTATTAPTESSDGDAQYLSDDSDDSDGSGGKARIALAVGLGRCVHGGGDPVRIQTERHDQVAGLTTPTAPTAPTESSDGDAQYHNDGSSGSGGRARISATRRTYPVFPLDNLDNLVGSFRVSRGRIWPDEFPAHTSPPCQWQRSTYFLCFSP